MIVILLELNYITSNPTFSFQSNRITLDVLLKIQGNMTDSGIHRDVIPVRNVNAHLNIHLLDIQTETLIKEEQSGAVLWNCRQRLPQAACNIPHRIGILVDAVGKLACTKIPTTTVNNYIL